MLEENNNYLKGYYFLKKKKTVIEKVNVSLTANREPHIPEYFIRSTVTWFYYCTQHTPPPSVESGHQIDQNTSGRFTLKTSLALSLI